MAAVLKKPSETLRQVMPLSEVFQTPAGAGAEVELAWRGDVASDGDHASAAMRADVAPAGRPAERREARSSVTVSHGWLNS